MAIISAALLCLRDIKLFTGFIGFFPEQISTRTHSHGVFHSVFNFLFLLKAGGNICPVLI